MGVCTLIAAIYIYYQQTSIGTTNNVYEKDDYVLLTCVLGFVLFSAVGFLIIPWTLIVELIPTEVKGQLCGLVVGVAYILMFSTVKSFPYAMDWIGIQGLFYIFSATSFATVLFVYMFVPETFGKSFKEISKNFTKK